MTRITSFALGAVLVLLSGLLLFAVPGAAQEAGTSPQPAALAPQNLRAYWHVFAAYAIAILMVGGWAISIARRLRGVEDRLLD